MISARRSFVKFSKASISPNGTVRIDRQLDDDSGGFGESNSIAIFGEPGTNLFEFVLTGRHMTIRCDGNTAEHVAFGGPIFYGHAADGFNEDPDHPGNVFWPQAVAANQLYQMLDGSSSMTLPWCEKVCRRSRKWHFTGRRPFSRHPCYRLGGDQREHVQEVMQKLVEPYRQSDRDEVIACLKTQGGLDACHLAFFAQQDIGDDGVWDSWRLEGPSFVWHYRGAPHVHVWVNVADDPGVQLNA